MGNRKQGICMADGGITQESPEQLMARMAAKYGAPTGATQQAQPQQQSPQQAPQQPQQKSNPLGIMSMLKGRTAQIDKAVNGYANGGIAGHVKFEGKGGPREDQIPVKVAGQKINVSDGEQALIIPAKTAANAQAMAAIKQIIADSNDGRQPDMGHGDSNFAEGGLLDDEARKMNYQAVTGVQAPAPAPQPAAQLETGGWSLGKSGPGATLQVTTGDAARLPAPAVQQGIATMRNQLATPQPAAASGSNYVGNGPTDPDTNGRQAIAAPSNAVQRGIETMRGQFNQNPAPSENALASAAENERIKSLYPAGTFDKPAAVTAPASAVAPKPGAGYTVEQGQAPANRISAAHQGILAASPSSARTQEVANANESSLGGRQGAYMIENNLRSFEDKGNGIARTVGANGQRSFTNVGTENVTDATKQIQTNSYDGAANNASMASANAIRQEMIDRQPQGGIGILGDGGIEAANAEKTARWRQDELLEKAARGNQAAVVAAINANASTANAATNATTNASAEAGRAGITMRGQDMASKNEAARLAGNPVENQLKQAQAQGIMAQTESGKMIDDIRKKALAGDPQAAASYRALTGKGGTENMRDNFMAVGGGQEFDATANVMRNVPQRLIDLRTGQEVGGKSAEKQGGAPKFSSPADVAAAKAAGTIKSGDVIETPNGLIKVK